MRSTSLLTEHLGYPPISLIDDIINAVNEIMYKCTNAMEKYLMERSVINGRDFSEEIQVGTAKLESLLENAVDKNFDKLELYVLRNILSIPSNLLDENKFRLLHHENLIITDEKSQQISNAAIEQKLDDISRQLALNKLLIERIKATTNLTTQIIFFRKKLLSSLRCENNDTVDLKAIWNDLKPLNKFIKLLTTRLKQLYIENEEFVSIDQVNKVFERYNELRKTSIVRNGYIENKSQAVLASLDLDVESPNVSPITLDSIEDPLIEDPDFNSIQKFS